MEVLNFESFFFNLVAMWMIKNWKRKYFALFDMGGFHKNASLIGLLGLR